MGRILSLATDLFPVWVLAGAVAALIHPPLFLWFKSNHVFIGLAIVMLGMGLTLTPSDFAAVLSDPRTILVGFVAQYLIMPLSGYVVAVGLQLDNELAVGIILVGCCPGGTASNVVTYLARANVPLSVLMTMCSTFAAVFMTPLLTRLLAGQYVDVDAWKLFMDTLQVVLLPLVVGMILNYFTPKLVKRVLPVAPLTSVILVALICASIIGQQRDSIMNQGPRLLLAVLLLHTLGFALGYAFAWAFKYDRSTCRTISIEVGMQNSALGASLAQRSFEMMPAAPTPCALSAVCHSVLGSLLAAYWRWRGDGRAKDETPADAG